MITKKHITLSIALNALLLATTLYFWHRNETACSRVNVHIAPSTTNWFPREFSTEELDLISKIYPVVADAEKKKNSPHRFYIHDIKIEQSEAKVVIGYFEMFLEPNFDYEIDGKAWKSIRCDGIELHEYTINIDDL